MLIRSPRWRHGDEQHWNLISKADKVVAKTESHRRRAARSEAELDQFMRGGGCYVGVSWGKDSVCVADMAVRLARAVPLVCIRCFPIENPDNDAVRDAFLAQHPYANYHEITVECSLDENGWHATGTMERGFAQAADRFGVRYISGICGHESAVRRKRMLRFGISTKQTCAPLGWWESSDVWAYLHARDLPIHPVYAMSMGGILERDRLRVAWLGLRHGRGWGREEWERTYYREEMAALDRGGQ